MLNKMYNYSFLNALIESEDINIYQFFKRGFYCEIEDYGLEIYEVLSISACDQNTYLVLELESSDISQLLNNEIDVIYTEKFSSVYEVSKKACNFYELINEEHLYKNTIEEIKLPAIKEEFYQFYGIHPHKLKVTKSTIRLHYKEWKNVLTKMQVNKVKMETAKKLVGFNNKRDVQNTLCQIVYDFAEIEWNKDRENNIKTRNGEMADRIIKNYLNETQYNSLLTIADMKPSKEALVGWFKKHKEEFGEKSFVPEYASDRGR